MYVRESSGTQKEVIAYGSVYDGFGQDDTPIRMDRYTPVGPLPLADGGHWCIGLDVELARFEHDSEKGVNKTVWPSVSP